MNEFECMYQTDENGVLVHYNEHPEYVERMYKLRQLISQLDSSYSILDNLVSHIEAKLFEDNGTLFSEWKKEKRSDLDLEIRAAIVDIFGWDYDCEKECEIKCKIKAAIENIIV